MLITLLSYLLPIIGLLGIGFVTFVKNFRSRLNLIFFLLSLTIAVWLLTLMAGNLVLDRPFSLWSVRAATFIGMPIAPLILYLSNAFPVQLHRPTWRLHVFALVPSLLFMSIAFTSILVPDVEIQGHSVQPSSVGLAYTLQTLYLIASFITAFLIMYRKLKRVSPRQRSQIRLVFFGLVGSLIINAVTGFVLALLDQASNYSDFAGALSFLAFIAAISYAMVRYRLFDIRQAIARVVGYAVTVGLVAGVYSALVLLVSTSLDSFSEIGWNQLVILLVPTIFIALTFGRIERVIAHATNKVFYQDIYDTREVLEKLSDALLRDNDIDTIMGESLSVLTSAIRPSKSYIAVLNQTGTIYKHAFSGGVDTTDVPAILRRLAKTPQNIVDREEQPLKPIAKLMEEHEVSLLVRLGTRTNPTGVLLFGSKQNGGMYTRRDIDLLRVSAKNLGIALDNAKKYEQILHFADTMHKEVRRATGRLRKANDELRTLDALKDDFISTASHQLRTPAMSVHDALQLLNHPAFEKEEDKQDLIRLAEASSERLVTVVRTMLNMARLQAGHFTIDRSNEDIVELAKKVLLQTQVLSDLKHIAVQFKPPKGPIVLSIDSAKVSEAMANYIENAIKYSPEYSTIIVVLEVTDDNVRFEVLDAGMGVPAEERKQLFGRFYRASNARQEQPDGNGIGLFVVRSIAEGHGGQAYYKPLDKGSLFGFNFPAQRPRK